VLDVERSRGGRVSETATAAGRGRAHVWEMAPVAGRGGGVLAMVSLERRS
jgi:hypothetical protein